jgi:hypothetical protein
MQVGLSAARQISRAASIGGPALTGTAVSGHSIMFVSRFQSINLMYWLFANESKGEWSLVQVKNGPASELWLATDLRQLSPFALGPHESAVHELHRLWRGLSHVRHHKILRL